MLTAWHLARSWHEQKVSSTQDCRRQAGLAVLVLQIARNPTQHLYQPSQLRGRKVLGRGLHAAACLPDTAQHFIEQTKPSCACMSPAPPEPGERSCDTRCSAPEMLALMLRPGSSPVAFPPLCPSRPDTCIRRRQHAGFASCLDALLVLEVILPAAYWARHVSLRRRLKGHVAGARERGEAICVRSGLWKPEQRCCTGVCLAVSVGPRTEQLVGSTRAEAARRGPAPSPSRPRSQAQTLLSSARACPTALCSSSLDCLGASSPAALPR